MYTGTLCKARIRLQIEIERESLDWNLTNQKKENQSIKFNDFCSDCQISIQS